MADQIGLTEEQQELRRTGVTGSEIAAVAGLSRWSSPIDVYQRKLGLVPEPEQNEHMERGTFLEAGLRRWLEHRKGYRVRQTGTLRHPDLDFVVATPDGAAHDIDTSELVAAVEIKSPSFRTADDWDDPTVHPDGIPVYYIPQVTWEMAVLGADVCDVAALLGGELRVYTVPYNAQLFEVLVEKAREFWRHVQDRTPPPVDGSGSASRWLKEQFPSHDPDMKPREATPEIIGTIYQYHDACEQLKAAEAAKQLAENMIKEWIGDAPGVEGPFGKISWKKTKDREGWDVKRLAAFVAEHHPDQIEQFARVTPGPRTFRATWKKGAR